MYQIIKKQVRPSIDVAFFNPTLMDNPDYLMYFTETYINTGKFILSDNAAGASDLELISTNLWYSKQAWDEFRADPRAEVEFRTVRAAYLEKYGIIETIESTTEI